MVIIHVAKTAGEWREFVMERDAWMCQAVKHEPRCHGRAEHAHHMVYKSHLSEKSHWLLENGIGLSDACHTLAHSTHNGNLDLDRCNKAVEAVNCIERVQVKKFTKKGAA